MQFWSILAVVSVACMLASPAPAVDFSNPAFAQVGEATSIPIGHFEFCRERPSECKPNVNPISLTVITDERWSELVQINNAMNSAISPVSDLDQYQVEERWTYPTVAGDCEDYVLAKRMALIEAGWAPSTLLIAVVTQASGEGHAVLIARTDRGDLVLDNQAGVIVPWNETPYFYVKRQSQYDAGAWVAISDDRDVVTASVK